MDRQVGALARAEDGKEAQAGDAEAAGGLRRVAQQLAAALGRAVGRERAVGRQVLGELAARPLAVHARGGGEHEAFDAAARRGVQHDRRAQQVHVRVGHRVLEARAARRRAPPGAPPRAARSSRRSWPRTPTSRMSPSNTPAKPRCAARAREVPLLLRARIEVVEGVQHGDLVAAREERFDQDASRSRRRRR